MSTTGSTIQTGTAGRSTNAARQDNFSSIAAGILDRAAAEEADADVAISDEDANDNEQGNQQQGDATKNNRRQTGKAKTQPAGDTDNNQDQQQDENNQQDSDDEQQRDEDDVDELNQGDEQVQQDGQQAAATQDEQEEDYQELEDLMGSNNKQTGDKTETDQQKDGGQTTSAQAELNDLLADPYVGELIRAKRKGINPYSVARSFVPVDFGTLTPEELIRMDCAREGVTDPKEIEAEITAWENKTPLERKKGLNSIVAGLTTEQKTRMEKIVTQQVSIEQQSKTIMADFESDVRRVTKDAIGKRFYGQVIDDKIAKQVEDLLLNKWNLFENGKINPIKAVSYGIYDIVLRDAMKKQHKGGVKKGKLEAVKRVAQPDKMNRSATNRNAGEPDQSSEGLVKGFVGSNAPVNQRSKKQ